jgi:DNA-binding beta-propeller fold protein YncE
VDLFVASYYDNRVVEYDGTTGALLGDFVPSGSGGLDGPHGLAFGPDGNLYVSSVNTSSVLRYDGSSGGFLDSFVPAGSGGLARATSGIFGPDGSFYVSSAVFGGGVNRYDGTTGSFLGTFVPAGSGGLGRPHGLAFGPDGNLYVTSVDGHFGESSVMRYDGTTGQPLPAPGQPGAYFVTLGSGGLSSPYGNPVFDGNGNLLVPSLDTANVLQYDGNAGAFLGAFVPAGSGGLTGPEGVGFGPDGNPYVVSQGNESVLRYDGTTGAFVDAFVPSGSGGLSGATYLVFWDTGMPGPRGNHGVLSHRVTASAMHAFALADSALLVGAVGISGPSQDGDALGNAAPSSDGRSVNEVTPALAIWTTTAGPVAAAIPDVPASPWRTHAAADLLFGAWPTDNSALEPLAWSGSDLLVASVLDGM